MLKQPIIPKRPLVLLVDDDANATAALAETLVGEGYDVTCLIDSQAVKNWLVSGTDPAMIIAEHLQSNATTNLAAWGQSNKVPVIVVTSSPDQAKAAFRERGLSVPIFCKPLLLGAMLEWIRKFVVPNSTSC